VGVVGGWGGGWFGGVVVCAGLVVLFVGGGFGGLCCGYDLFRHACPLPFIRDGG